MITENDEMKSRNPLEAIWRSRLCCGCGACAAVCPQGVIELQFSQDNGFYSAALADNSKGCIGCGLCARVCPVESISTDKGEPSISGQLPGFADWLIGPYKKVYTGHARDGNLRFECSSGGVATALLRYLFETRRVDSALITGRVADQPLRHKCVLVKSIDEVVKGKGTIYCQIDFSPAWEFIRRGDSRMTIVGQPCQLKAVELFTAAEKLDVSKVFKIGLFCGGMTSHRALEYLCKRKGIVSGDVLSVRYRSGGWPGRRMLVTTVDPNQPKKTREVVLFDRDASIFQTYLYSLCFGGSFYPRCCQVCRDQTAETADISLGDAWLPRVMMSDRLGTNIIICRTTDGEEILHGAVASNAIVVHDARPDEVLRSQGNCLVGRKLGLWGKHLRNPSPDVPALNASEQWISQYIPKRGLLVERRFFQWLTKYVPSGSAFGLFLVWNFMKSVLGKCMRILRNFPGWRP